MTSLREVNSSLKQELEAAHAEGETKAKRIVDLGAELAETTTTAHEWHVKAKKLETLLQQAKANEHWARSIVAQSVRSAPQPQGYRGQGGGSQGSHSASAAHGLPPKP